MNTSTKLVLAGNVVVRNNTIRDSYWLWGDVSASGKPGFLDGLGIKVSASDCAADKNPTGKSRNVHCVGCATGRPVGMLFAARLDILCQ